MSGLGLGYISDSDESDHENVMKPPPPKPFEPFQMNKSDDESSSDEDRGTVEDNKPDTNKKPKKITNEEVVGNFRPPSPKTDVDLGKRGLQEDVNDNNMLRMLKMRRNESRKLNHVEVQEEEKRAKLPANWEQKKRRLEWELSDQHAREEAEKEGKDYDILKNMNKSAQELEYYGRKAKKKNPDPGFADFAQSHFRQYERISGQIRVNNTSYEEQKRQLGESFFPQAGDILTTGRPSQSAIDKMAADVDRQIEKRSKYSRRRTHVDDADISYINERNKKFNEKCERYFGKYTDEIKQNLERGTAL